jgi:GntR family transcriptional repressor for pyruvate dehydrogenase complex
MEAGPIRAPKLPHLVAERLRARIAKGELEPGDKLPSETELLKEFGVSRPTLREALRVLESETLIHLGRGARHGATVLAPSVEMAARYGALYLASHGTTLGQIHEVRTLLEPPLASLHAQNPSREFLETLEQCVQDQHAALDARDYVAAVAAVNEFHDILVRFSNNTALCLIAGMLHDISVKVYPQLPLTGARRADRDAVWVRSAESTTAHQRLVELIADGSAEEARAFWREYMQDTAAYLRKTGFADLQVHAAAEHV